MTPEVNRPKLTEFEKRAARAVGGAVGIGMAVGGEIVSRVIFSARVVPDEGGTSQIIAENPIEALAMEQITMQKEQARGDIADIVGSLPQISSWLVMLPSLFRRLTPDQVKVRLAEIREKVKRLKAPMN